jgi:hypothetical protein
VVDEGISESFQRPCPELNFKRSHRVAEIGDYTPPSSFGQQALLTVAIRWDEKAGLRRDAVRSQVIEVLKGTDKKETGNEEG